MSLMSLICNYASPRTFQHFYTHKKGRFINIRMNISLVNERTLLVRICVFFINSMLWKANFLSTCLIISVLVLDHSFSNKNHYPFHALGLIVQKQGHIVSYRPIVKVFKFTEPVVPWTIFSSPNALCTYHTQGSS